MWGQKKTKLKEFEGKQNKTLIYFAVIVLIGFLNLLSCSYNKSLKDLGIQKSLDKECKHLICDNDSLFTAIKKYKNSVEDSLVIDVVKKIKNEELELEQGIIFLELYAKTGTNWSLGKLDDRNYIEFETVDEYLAYDSIVTAELLQPSFNAEKYMDTVNVSEYYKILRKNNTLTETVKKFKDSIEYFRVNQDYKGLDEFLKKVQNTEGIE